MALIAVALASFFTFQSQVDLHTIFGYQTSNRIRTTGMLISHDLESKPRQDWQKVLSKHAKIHGVDFILVLEDGSRISSTDQEIPETVLTEYRLNSPPPPPQHRSGDPHHMPPPEPPDEMELHDPPEPPSGETRSMGGHRPPNDMPPPSSERHEKKTKIVMRTQNPTAYWSGIQIPIPGKQPSFALLLAKSDSISGNGFFFDPLPWMVVAVVVILISVLLWIPIVGKITRALVRMTQATEKIADGHFDVSIHEAGSDEIGRLARAINNMASRLSAFVTGQKRFLGDVAHELGSPVARIQFGLGALEQRIDKENRERIKDVMEDVDHLAGLVNELLAFSRADLKSDTVRLGTIMLLPAVQSAVKREAGPMDNIVTQIDPQIRVTASSELMTRAVANLLRNALKYAGGAGTITISAKKMNGTVELEVRDAGPGVPDDLVDQLFEPFFRPEASRDRDSGGVGLGLAIVKTCVETCKGRVSAANLEPHGFAVTITLKAP